MFTNWTRSDAPEHLLEKDSITALTRQCVEILERMYNDPKMTWRNLFDMPTDEDKKAASIIVKVASEVTWARQVMFVRKNGEMFEFGAGKRDKSQIKEWKSLDGLDIYSLLNSLKTAAASV